MTGFSGVFPTEDVPLTPSFIRLNIVLAVFTAQFAALDTHLKEIGIVITSLIIFNKYFKALRYDISLYLKNKNRLFNNINNKFINKIIRLLFYTKI
ncbi:hypothetical protein [Candidatus Regiella insecticola]|uniref:hypothetical protein n=1 Tax=Candidatus Regiella insecticola TaxID=138073 RepID=UPI001C3F1A26|nr:hypothetical protein [Candidatus Regiella insecticola]